MKLKLYTWILLLLKVLLHAVEHNTSIGERSSSSACMPNLKSVSVVFVYSVSGNHFNFQVLSTHAHVTFLSVLNVNLCSQCQCSYWSFVSRTIKIKLAITLSKYMFALHKAFKKSCMRWKKSFICLLANHPIHILKTLQNASLRSASCFALVITVSRLRRSAVSKIKWGVFDKDYCRRF